jgi:hypothetical protein
LSAFAAHHDRLQHFFVNRNGALKVFYVLFEGLVVTLEEGAVLNGGFELGFEVYVGRGLFLYHFAFH